MHTYPQLKILFTCTDVSRKWHLFPLRLTYVIMWQFGAVFVQRKQYSLSLISFFHCFICTLTQLHDTLFFPWSKRNKHISLNTHSLISIGQGLYSQSRCEKKSIDLILLFESDGHMYVSDRLKLWNALGCIRFTFYEYRPRTIEREFETVIWSKIYRFNLCFNTLTYTTHT